MYTVVRFVIDNGDQKQLEALGAELNRLSPGLFDGLHRDHERFSCSIDRSDDWEEHKQAVIDFLDQCKTVITHAHELGVDVQLDVAIDEEDCENCAIKCLLLDVEFLQRLSAYGVSFVFSIYTF